LPQLLLLRGAKQLLTLRGAPNVRRGAQSEDLAVIQDGSILIRNGRIASVGSTRRLENMQEARDAIDVPVHGCVVMPGFVDPGMQLSLFDSKDALRPRRKRLQSFYEESVALMRGCLQHGTLTAGIRARPVNGFTGSDVALLRQMARIGNNPVNVVRAWRIGWQGGECPPLEAINNTLTTLRKHRLATMVELGAHNLRSDSALLCMLNNAQMEVSLNWRGSDHDQLARALQAASPACVFCDSNLSSAECQVLAKSRSTAIFTAHRDLLEDAPGGSLRDLADAGGALALTSGYDAESENNFNMQWVVALAVMRLRLSVEQAIVASTINAAYAMRCGSELGSLEVNKRAEILVLNLDDYRELPRRLGTNHVGMVIRDGNIVLNRSRWRVGAA
jgi:imidazolonepropionase